MSSTYSQIYVQVIFAVKGRSSLINQKWEEELYKYITGIIKKKDQHLLAINGMPDHIHFLIRLRPACRLSDLVQEIKKSSNEFIKEEKFLNSIFSWQEGYGAFSYSYSGVQNVVQYIQNQKLHHQKKSFKDEYIEFLNEFQIEYKEEHLFDWIDLS